MTQVLFSIIAIIGIIMMVIAGMLGSRDLIPPKVGAVMIGIGFIFSAACLAGSARNDFQARKLEDYETVVTIKPIMTTRPLYTGDEVYIYGYKKDGSLYEGSGEIEYTVYDTENGATYVEIKCTTDEAKDLMKMSRECDIEVKKVE